MKRFFSIIMNLPELATGILIILVSVLVFSEVIFRYFLNYSLGWSEELARIFFIWISLLGAAVCVKRGQHYSFAFFEKMMSRRSASLINIIVTFLVVVFSAIFTVYGYKSFILSFRQSFTALGVTWGWAFAAVPISGVLMCIYSIPFLIRNSKAFLHPEEAPSMPRSSTN